MGITPLKNKFTSCDPSNSLEIIISAAGTGNQESKKGYFVGVMLAARIVQNRIRQETVFLPSGVENIQSSPHAENPTKMLI